MVVDHNTGESLTGCVASLVANGVTELIVVENGAPGSSEQALGEGPANGARVVRPGRNLGYGGGANAGVREVSSEYVLVSNADLVLAAGAIDALVRVLDAEPDVAIVGPMLRETNGDVYPSGRDFPDLSEAIGHGFVGLFWGGNPWTRRYRRLGPDQHAEREADWVSGACFLARREAYWSVGGFDEAYFMYSEDVDLCWRLRRAGWRIRYTPQAEVIHEQGRSTSRHPYRMLAAHHRSLWRFARRSTTGRQRGLLPLIGAGLLVRLVLAWLEHLVGARARRRRAHD